MTLMFYSMLNSENKPYDSKISPIMLCRFLNDLSALEKYRNLHIENLTSNKKIRVSSF